MAGNVRFYDYHPPVTDFRTEVISGLTQSPKQLSPKYFYDQRGSELFEAITELPEYYPTRTELGILEDKGEEIAEFLGEDCALVELGSGSSRKIRVLLDALQPAAYVPMDISRDHLLDAAHALANDYPELEVHAACTDYSNDLRIPDLPEHMARAAFFPGSSIGNFEPEEAGRLLNRLGQALGENGRLLIGVDLKKQDQILHAAYNDEQQVTAAFNLNLLERMNRELGADFDIDGFEHRAWFNEAQGRIEMHLVSKLQQRICVGDTAIDFQEGESVHTESSYKYSVEEFQSLAEGSGFASDEVWTDDKDLFSVHCLRYTA